jgi:two-component system sensor kinase FixL
MNREEPISTGDALELLHALEQQWTGQEGPEEQLTEEIHALSRLQEGLLGNNNGHSPEVSPLGNHSDQEVIGARLAYRELFDFTTEAQFITSPTGIILDANRAAADLLRARKEFLIDKPLPLFVHPSCRFDFYSCLTRWRKGGLGTVQEWHGRLQPLRGRQIDVMVWVAEINDEQSRPISLRWLMRDLSALRAAELALMAERDFVKSLLDNAQAIILVLDNNQIVRTNLYLSQVSGYRAEELLGQPWAALLPADEHAIAQSLMDEAVETGMSQRRSGSLVTKGGLRRNIDWSVKAFIRADTRTCAVVAIGHDITELQAAQKQALRAERLAALGQMMARLAHESRNLLQRCQSCLERLSWRLADQPESLDLVKRAQATQHDLTHLFEDIRTYAAPLRLERTPCELRQVWREAWEQVRMVGPDKEAILAEDCDEDDTMCSVDRFRLLQVFRNLFNNSFDARRGRVEVEIRCRSTDLEGKPAMELTFRDNGTGLSAEQRQRIFEPFYSTKPYGTGLGMAIVKRLVEAHGGRITLGKDMPLGAEFIVTLPRTGT